MKHLYLWPCDDGTYDICEDGEVIRQNMPAAVILAAPELLAAVQRMVNGWGNGNGEEDAIILMRAAIAKATGE